MVKIAEMALMRMVWQFDVARFALALASHFFLLGFATPDSQVAVAAPQSARISGSLHPFALIASMPGFVEFLGVDPDSLRSCFAENAHLLGVSDFTYEVDALHSIELRFGPEKRLLFESMLCKAIGPAFVLLPSQAMRLGLSPQQTTLVRTLVARREKLLANCFCGKDPRMQDAEKFREAWIEVASLLESELLEYLSIEQTVIHVRWMAMAGSWHPSVKFLRPLLARIQSTAHRSFRVIGDEFRFSKLLQSAAFRMEMGLSEADFDKCRAWISQREWERSRVLAEAMQLSARSQNRVLTSFVAMSLARRSEDLRELGTIIGSQSAVARLSQLQIQIRGPGCIFGLDMSPTFEIQESQRAQMALVVANPGSYTAALTRIEVGDRNLLRSAMDAQIWKIMTVGQRQRYQNEVGRLISQSNLEAILRDLKAID